MSLSAAELILHPNVSQGLALVATTIGRDKVCPISCARLHPARLISARLATPFSQARSGWRSTELSRLTFQVFRLIQYLSRLVAWSLIRRGRIEGGARFNGLKVGLTNVRKGQYPISTF